MASSSPTSFERHGDFSLTAILHACDMMTEDIVQTKVHWFTYDYCLDFRLTNYARPTPADFYTVISQANGIISLIDIPATTADPASIAPTWDKPMLCALFVHICSKFSKTLSRANLMPAVLKSIATFREFP